MVWLLRFNHLRQHGGKAPYRVSGLPCCGTEIFNRQGVKRTKGQRVAIHHQQSFIGGLGHAGLSPNRFICLLAQRSSVSDGFGSPYLAMMACARRFLGMR